MIKAFIFDAFGTLFDTSYLIDVCEKRFPGAGAATAQLWRQKQLEYSWLRTLMQRYADFDKITKEALQFAVEQSGIHTDGQTIEEICKSYESLPLFPDAKQFLSTIGDEKRVILSNGTLRTLQAVTANHGITFDFDYILSADAVRAYKPDVRVYNLALQKLGVEKSEVVFVTANDWDAIGAKSFGYQVAWCNRNQHVVPRLSVQPDFTVQNLTDVTSILSLR